jgi:large subunit ribosomal protein L18Ae
LRNNQLKNFSNFKKVTSYFLLYLQYYEYVVVGREKPSPKDPNPKIYRMRIFAKNDVVAKARFWHFLRTLRKIKHTHGELLGIWKVSPFLF